MAGWADVICEYLASGYPGIVALATNAFPDTTNISFCAAVLGSLKTSQSVAALARISHALIPTTIGNLAQAVEIAEQFNLVLSLRGSPTVDSELENDVRSFLNMCLTLELSAPQRYPVTFVLRAVGDTQSIEIVKVLLNLKPPYEGLEAKVTRAIRKGLKQRATGA